MTSRGVSPVLHLASRTGPVVIYLSHAIRGHDVFEVLLHELAHLLFGHLAPDPLQARRQTAARLPRLRHFKAPREFEAESAAAIAGLRRRGVWRDRFEYLHANFDGARAHRLLPLPSVLLIFAVSEILVAWCRAKPDQAGVPITWSRSRPQLSVTCELELLLIRVIESDSHKT